MRGAPSPLGLEKNTVRPLMAVQVLPARGRLGAELLGVVLDDRLRQAIGDPGCVRRRAARLRRQACDAELEGLEQPALLHQQEGGQVRGIDHVDLQAAGVGLGQHLRRDVVGAAAVVLHVDAVLVLEAA